jgi:Flp pilus assembly protein TadB
VALAMTVAILLISQGLPILLAVFLGLFAGISLPHFTIGFLIKRRVNKFTQRFPDAIELMVRGLRSGLPISETIGIVGTEIPGPISDEFNSVSDKMKIGRTMEAALQETADRLGTPEFQFFVITLADSARDRRQPRRNARNLADVLRKRAQMKLKIKAMSVGVQGFGLHHRLAALHRLRPDLLDQSGLYGRLLHRPATDDRGRRRPVLDGDRRRDHGQDDQLRDLRRATHGTGKRTHLPRRRPHPGRDLPFGGCDHGGARRHLCGDHRARSDGQARQGAERAARAAQGRHRRLDLQAPQEDHQYERAADRFRTILGSLKMLQDEQVEKAQIKLMQAGIRSKDLAFVVIFARFVLPVVIGITMVVGVFFLDWFSDYSAMKRYGILAGSLIGAYKAPDVFIKNKIQKRTNAIRKGLPDALDLLVICAEAGLTIDAAFSRVSRELGRAYPELGDGIRPDLDRAGLPTDRRSAFENLAMRIDLEQCVASSPP